MTSPASFSTYGGHCLEHPESNLTRKDGFWRSATADGRRGVIVTFERTVKVTHFFGYFHILIILNFQISFY